MDQPNNCLPYHRRASSDHAYHRKSIENRQQQELDEELGRLNKEQQHLLSTVREMVKLEAKLPKVDKIRIMQWLEKLSSRPTNTVWRKNINFYLKVLIEMIHQQEISPPFSAVPPQGALLNLKLLDLPFPIREKIAQKQKMAIYSSSKVNSRQGSVSKHYCKARSINLHQELRLDEDINDESFKANVINQAKKQTSIKSCQVSEKRAGCQDKAKLKLTADHDKQNNSRTINSSCVTRRLFQNQTIQTAKNSTLQTYKAEQPHAHNTTVCSFDAADHQPSKSNNGVSLLLKVYDLIQKNADLDSDAEAQAICCSIKGIAQQLGVLLPQGLDQSGISCTSKQYEKAREHMRLKLVESEEETLEFMTFLQRFRLNNQ